MNGRRVVWVWLLLSPTLFSAAPFLKFPYWSEPSVEHLKENCPEPLRTLNERASSAFIYWLAHGEHPMEKCFKERSMPPVKELANVFIQKMGTSEDRPSSSPLACAPDISNPEQRKSLLFTQRQYYRERINRGAMGALIALQEIDSVLADSPLAFKSINCNANISSKVEEMCRKLKECPGRSQREALVELTHYGLKKRRELVRALEIIERKVRRYRRHPEKIQNLKDARDTLSASIAEINAMVPWLNGRLFEKNIEKIERSIAGQEDDTATREQIEKALSNQFRANKKELLRLYDQFSEAVDCLKGRQKCDRFSSILSRAPSALPDYDSHAPDLPEDIRMAYRQFEVVQCLEEEVGNAGTYDGIALSAGEVGLGLMIGGVGGIYGLAANIFRGMRHGHHVKGVVSLLGMGALGDVGYRNIELVKKECKGALRHIEGIDYSSAVCASRSYPQNVARYLSCLSEIALTLAAVAPPVLGQGIRLNTAGRVKIAKNIDKTKQISKFRDIKNLEDIKKYRSLLNSEQVTNFSHLLDEFTPKELKLIRPYLNKLEENKIDPLLLHRALRYSRALSGKKRKDFIAHLDEALEGKADSGNRQVRSFLRGEKRHAKRVARIEKKYQGKKAFNETDHDSITDLARRQSHRVEDVLLSCRSRNMNASHQRSIGLFKKFSMGMASVSVVTGFANANWHLPKDVEWFGRLGYELVYVLMYTKVLVSVVKNPSNSLLKRYGQFNVGASLVEGVDTYIYSQFFNIDEDDARDALNRIKNAPEKQQALQELSQYLDDSGFVEQFKKSLAANMKGLLGILEEDLKHIREKDLDDPKVQDKLLEALMAQYYDSSKGYFSLGSKGADRLAYNRTWSAMVSIPRDIALALPLYYSLCLTSIWPVGGVAVAAGIQTLNQLLANGAYYQVRKDLINQ